jgi:purine-nucleoside phosphorylase
LAFAAKFYTVDALSILTVSDSLVTGEDTTAKRLISLATGNTGPRRR